MAEGIRRPKVWLRLTIPIAALLAMASGGGLFIDGLYRDTPYFAAQAVGQDLVSLSVVLPLLIISAILTSRGSLRTRLIWLGGLTYLVYTYVIAAFDVRFNSLFLVYVALLGCSVYALIGGMITMSMAQIKACFREKTPAKAISIYLGVLAVLFYFLWLSEVVPALLRGEIPKSVQDNGTPANAVHVLDMAWILPAFLMTSVSLWRKLRIYARRGAPFLLRASNVGDSVNGGFHDSGRPSGRYRTGGNFRGALCTQRWNANMVYERLEITQHLGFTGRPWRCCPQARRLGLTKNWHWQLLHSLCEGDG